MRATVLFLVRFYQTIISPFLPKTCRFEPSCSSYAIQSIQEKGCAKGLAQTLIRILKCHPFHPGGYDPV